jgi:hypothetical protein
VRWSRGVWRAPSAVTHAVDGRGLAPMSRRVTVELGCPASQLDSAVSAIARVTEPVVRMLASSRNSFMEGSCGMC